MISFIKKQNKDGVLYWYLFIMTPTRYRVNVYTSYSKARAYRHYTPHLEDMDSLGWFIHDYGHMFKKLNYYEIYNANLKCCPFYD